MATGFAGLEPRINPLAIAAFVSGLVIPLWPLSSIAAVVLATVSMRQMSRHPTERGRGLALAGLVLGIVGIAAAAVGIVLVVAVDWRCLGGCTPAPR